MDYDYNKRGYLLPNGCKDLIDVIEPKTEVTARAFVVTVQLPELLNGELEITAEGRTMWIVAKQVNGEVPFETTVEIPAGYAVADARAVCVGGQLRIVVPRANLPAAEF